MFAEYAGKLWGEMFGPTGIVAGLVVVAVAFIRAFPPMFKTSKEAEGSLDELQAKRIDMLEKAVDALRHELNEERARCDAQLREMRHNLNNEMTVLDTLLMLIDVRPDMLAQHAEMIRKIRIERRLGGKVTPSGDVGLADLARQVERKP